MPSKKNPIGQTLVDMKRPGGENGAGIIEEKRKVKESANCSEGKNKENANLPVSVICVPVLFLSSIPSAKFC